MSADPLVEAERPVARDVAAAKWSVFYEAASHVFWIPGLVLLTILFGMTLISIPSLHINGKTFDWAIYVILGLAIPVAVLAALLFAGRVEPGTRFVPLARKFLTAVCWVVLVLFAVTRPFAGESARLLLALVLAGLTILVIFQPWRDAHIELVRMWLAAIAAFAAWLALIPGDIWDSMSGSGAYRRAELNALNAGLSPLGALVAVVFVGLAIRSIWQPTSQPRFRILAPENLIAYIVIVLMSFRTDRLFDYLGVAGAMQHWGAWVGPAEMVRQGNWLLWDVPAMYGFLSAIPLAILPTSSPWQSLYLIQGLLVASLSIGVYVLVRRFWPTWGGWLFALTMAVIAPMFAPALGYAAAAVPTFVLPNGGPYRYLWVAALVVVLGWALLSAPSGKSQRWMWVAGTVCWLAGVMWSVESAFFCTAIWGAAYPVMVLQSAWPRPDRWRFLAAWLSVPVVSLGAVVLAIESYYRIRLGHGPDWLAFVDYISVLGAEVHVAQNVLSQPSATGFLLVICLFTTVATYFGIQDGWRRPTLGPWLGLVAGLWALGAYTFTRANVVLQPVVTIMLLLLLLVVARRHAGDALAAPVVVASGALLVASIADPIGWFLHSPGSVVQVLESYPPMLEAGLNIDSQLPDADEQLQALMTAAGISPDQAISYDVELVGTTIPPWLPGSSASADRVVSSEDWTPAHGYVLMRYIPQDRARLYIDRMNELQPKSGWLIHGIPGRSAWKDKAPELDPGNWFADYMLRTHLPVRAVANSGWQAVWFELQSDVPDQVRPRLQDGIGVRLPQKILVDGVPVLARPRADIWALYGPGWNIKDLRARSKGSKPRDAKLERVVRMDGTASIAVYSQEAREVNLTLIPERIRGKQIELSVSDDAWATMTGLKSGQAATAKMALSAGWNNIDLTLMGKKGNRVAMDLGSISIDPID